MIVDDLPNQRGGMTFLRQGVNSHLTSLKLQNNKLYPTYSTFSISGG